MLLIATYLLCRMKGLPKRAALRSESPKAKMLGTSNVSLDVKKKDVRSHLNMSQIDFVL